MKKVKRYDRKNLKNRLSCIMLIYLDGLGAKKKDKMKKYLDEKLVLIVDHYVALLKKKNLRMANTNISVEQIEKLCPEARQFEDTANSVTGNLVNTMTEEPIQQ